jgi:hypothetical protein
MPTDEPLTPWQKAKICSIVLLGCDRSTACRYVGARPAQLQEELARDAAFESELLRAEAEAELRHMANVHKASLDEKNWRTSVWWLEQRAQARSAAAAGEGDAHVAQLIDDLAQAIVAEVRDVSVQRRLIERLWKILDGADDATQPFVIEGKVLSGPTPVDVDAAPAHCEEEPL